MSGARRGVVSLGTRCDNACVFCAQEGLPRALVETADARAALEVLRARCDAVTFSGGEPLLHPELDALVAHARALGFVRIGLQTNGRGLAARAAALAAAGMHHVHGSMHGAHASAHDYHTGVAGSHDALLDGLAAARRAGLEVVLCTVLTRSNMRELGALAQRVATLGVAAWVIDVPVVAGRAGLDFDRVMPRLGLAVPYALHAVELARKVSVRAWIRGAPLCLLGPLASRALPSEPRAYAPVCEACDARPACPGLDPQYLQRFEGDELSLRDAPQTASDLDAELAARFVGTGERAPATRRVPSAAGKVALPLAPRVAPGKQEAPRGGARKSGEALKQLFPSLFEGDAPPTEDDGDDG